MSARAEKTTDRTPEFDLANRLALRPKEAADVLGVSERTLRQMLPELPVVRRGGVVPLVEGENLRAQVGTLTDEFKARLVVDI